MLREMNAATRAFKGNNFFSKSQFQSNLTPQPTRLLGELDAQRQPETDQRNAGVNTEKSILDNGNRIDLRV